MKRRAIVFVLSVLVTFIAVGCATMPEQLRDQIDKENYEKVVEQGEKYLAKDPDAEDAAEVRSLVMEADFLLARQKDTVEGYDYFLNKYPDNPYQREAVEGKSVAYFRSVTEPANTVTAYAEFQERFPQSSLYGEARKRECSLAFQAADKEGTLSSYKDFRNKYDHCEQSREALTKETELAWQDARQAGTVEALAAFAKNYPDSKYTEEALAMVCDKAYAAALAADTISAYDEFYNSYPGCPQSGEALAKATDKAWDRTCAENTWSSYLAFMNAYPDSRYFREAESRYFKLWYYSGPVGADEYQAKVTTVNDKNKKRIELYLQVWGDDGQPVGGILGENFQVLENGCWAEIVDFEGMESERPVDIVFVFDVSGSMGEEIDGVKMAAIQFAEELRMRNRDFRLGLVAFHDWVLGVYPNGGGLTGNIREFENYVAQQTADNGNMEDALEALMVASRKNFRKEAQVIFILITDEPIYLQGRRTGWNFGQVISALRKKNITLFSISPDQREIRQMVDGTGGQLFIITNYPDFSGLIEYISTITAKQYHLFYRDTGCGGGGRNPRVRVKKPWAGIRVSCLETCTITSLVSNAAGDLLLAATRGKGVFRSQNGGLDWERVSDSLPDQSFARAMFTALDGSRALALSETGRVYVSDDSGLSFRLADSAPPGVTSITQDPIRPDIIFATDGTGLYLSLDGGFSFEKKSDLSETRTEIDLSYDPRRGELLVLEPGRASVSRDKGKSWQAIEVRSPEPPISLSSFRVHQHPAWPGIIFALKPGGALYRSLDRGLNWHEITPNLPTGKKAACHNLVFDPTVRHWLLLSTSQGVFVSSNHGLTWIAVAEGMEDREKQSPAIDVSASGLVRIGGSGACMYQLNPVIDREFISGTGYFDTGSAKIKPSLRGYLDRLADYMLSHPQAVARVEGHTDDVGEDDYNIDLSLRRAQSVIEYLAGKGVPQSRMIAVGYGESRPLFPNSNSRNRARNRRVELTIIGDPVPLPAYNPWGPGERTVY